MNSKTVLTAALGAIAGIGLVMGSIAYATNTGHMGNTQGASTMGQGASTMGQGASTMGQGGGMMGGRGGGMMGGRGGMMGQTTQPRTTVPAGYGTMHDQAVGNTTPGTMHGQTGKTGTHGTMHGQTGKTGTHGTMHGQAGKTGTHGNMHGQAGPQNPRAAAMPHASANQNPGNTTCPGDAVGST